MLKTTDPPPENTNRMMEASERSIAVQSANWKEHMLLQKRLSTLNRAERSLVHRITIDQKIMFRRFQMKLHKSKIGHAELMGEKETVRELRSLYLRGLNTNCGQRDGDYDFLKKLQYRPCSIGATQPRIPKKEAGHPSRKVTKERNQVRSKSAGPRLRRGAGDASARGSSPSSGPQRPATAAGTRVEEEFTVLPNVSGVSVSGKIDAVVAGIYNSGKDVDKHDGTSMSTGSNADQAHGSSVGFHRDMLPLALPAIPDSARSFSRKATGKTEEQSLHRSRARRGSMFEEVKKTDWLEIRLNEAKAVDHSQRIKEFCDSLTKYENLFQDESFDYYAHNMQVSMDCVSKDVPVEMPGTPEAEQAKYIGNPRVKSLTMPFLEMSFEENIYFDSLITSDNDLNTPRSEESTL